MGPRVRYTGRRLQVVKCSETIDLAKASNIVPSKAIRWCIKIFDALY